MTACELAEKVYKIVMVDAEYDHSILVKIESLLSAALAEAENRIWKEAKEDAWVQWQKDVKAARAEAFEEAAKIAEGHFGLDTVCPEYIAGLIRRRAGEGK